MKRLELDDQALLWLGLGASLLGLAAIKASITIAIPEQAWTLVLVLGGISSLLGIGLGVASAVRSVREPAQEVLERTVFRRQESPRFVTYARLGDIAKLHRRYAKEFGDDIPSLDLMKAWLERCDTCFVLVYEQADDQAMDVNLKLAGSFKMLPITSDAVRELEQGKISGSTFRPDHICAERDAAAFYVGDLFAAGIASGAAVLFHLDSKCKQVIERGYTIYARPFTLRGKRVMANRGFMQLSTGKDELEMRQLCRLTGSSSVPSQLAPSGFGIRKGPRRAIAVAEKREVRKSSNRF